MHTTRLTDPAMDIGDLPPSYLVLLSHFHGDHFDQVAERDLDKALPILTTPEAAVALHKRGFKNATGLEQWATKTVNKGTAQLRITSMPGRHGPPSRECAASRGHGQYAGISSRSRLQSLQALHHR